MGYTLFSSRVICDNNVSNIHNFHFLSYSLTKVILWRAETFRKINFNFMNEDCCD